MKPIYTTKDGQIKILRRRIGQMPTSLRKELATLSKWERVQLEVGAFC